MLKQVQILPDQIIPADIDETPYPNELPANYALRMAEKAGHIVDRLMDEYAGPIGHVGTTVPSGVYVLAGDTVVALAGAFFRKLKLRNRRVTA